MYNTTFLPAVLHLCGTSSFRVQEEEKIFFFFEECMSARILNPQREKVALTIHSCIIGTLVI